MFDQHDGNLSGDDGSPPDDGRNQPASPEERAELDRILHDLYVKLKPLARRLSSPRISPTLNPTALLNEACIRILNNSRELHTRTREEIIRIFAHVMRQVLVDRARYKLSAKRGGGVIHIPLNPGDPLAPDLPSPAHPVPVETVLTLETALIELERVNRRQALIVECRTYLGLTADETALLLDTSKSTIEREHRKALEFLNGRIEPRHS